MEDKKDASMDGSSADTSVKAETPEVKNPNVAKKGGIGAGPKLLIVGCVVLGGFLLALLLGGTALAFFSNKNIPVFSDVVEVVENTVVSESMTDEAIQDDVNDFVFSTLADMAPESGAYTKEDAMKYVKNEYKVESLRYDANVVLDMGDSGSLDMDMDGYSSQKNDMTQLEMNISGTYTTQGVDMDFAGEMRYADDIAYLQITEMPDALAQGFGVDSSTLKDQWFSMDATSSTDTVSSLGLDGGLTQSVVGSDTSLTADDLEKLNEFIYSDAMANAVERIDDEVIEGVRTNCFTLTLNQTTAEELAKAYAEIWGEEVDQSEIGTLLGEDEEVLLTVCSGRQDGQIYKVDMSVTYADGTSITASLKIWDYNKVDDAVEVPEDAVSFEDFYTQLLSGMYGGTDLTLPSDSTDEFDQLLEQYTDSNGEVDWDSLYQEYGD